MRKDLEDKVVVTLARFDEAVKQSNTRRRSKSIDSAQQEQEPDRDLDLAERIAAAASGAGSSSSSAGMSSCTPSVFRIHRHRFLPSIFASVPEPACVRCPKVLLATNGCYHPVRCVGTHQSMWNRHVDYLQPPLRILASLGSTADDASFSKYQHAFVESPQ